MAEIISMRHERLDDVPLIIGMANQLHLADLLNTHLGTHGLQQGLDNGPWTVGWLADLLSQADHRKSAVREWAQDLPETLHRLLGQPLRAVDFTDDRLAGVLHRLSNDAGWEARERDLWAACVAVYALPLTGVRLDSTTSAGHHQPQPAGLMQYGHSKDHRPDLAQLKLMAAAAEPQGHWIACAVHAGQAADDPLYTPLIQRVRQLLGQTGLLYTGDCKMAALATRAELVSQQDFYLVPLPLRGETKTAFETWVTDIVEGAQMASLVRDGPTLLGAGYEFERAQCATLPDAAGTPQSVQWTERVLVVRSLALAQAQQATLEQHLTAAMTALRQLTPAPGRGKRQFTDETKLQAALTATLERDGVTGLLEVPYTCETTTVTRYRGRGRGSPMRATYTATQVRYVIQTVQRNEAAIQAQQWRLGWRVQVTNASAERLPLSEAIVHYRGGWVLERDFHLVKDLPLGLSPLFVWKEDQIKGLVRLLTLALRILLLIETQVRAGLARTAETIQGLYDGQANRATARPTGKRLLRFFAKAKITLTRVETRTETEWYVTPLSARHQQILRYLRLPLSLYTALNPNSS